MTDHQAAPSVAIPPRRGLAEKRQAILDGALTVFSRDGYTRAGVGAIAQEACVSTRTIYNHFADKAQLFLAVILESAARVRDAQIAQIQRHLDKVLDLEAELLSLAREFTERRDQFEAHFSLVRQIYAEVHHVPTDVVQAWQDSGPRAVVAEMSRHLAKLAEQGHLQIPDPDQAAYHFLTLVATPVSLRTVYGALPLDDTEKDAIVTAGVQAFLRAYAP